MNLGSAVEQLRRKKGIKQNQLAAKAEITQSYLSLIESNKKEPNIKTLKLIAEALDVPVPILFIYSLNEDDIPQSKQQAYTVIQPILHGLIETYF